MKRDINAGQNDVKSILKGYIKELFPMLGLCRSITAYAEEEPDDDDLGDDDLGDDTGDAGSDQSDEGSGSKKKKKSSSTLNFEDLIQKARKEEKQKQYSVIQKLKTQNKSLTEQHNTDLLVVAELKEKVANLEESIEKAGKGDSEAVTELKKQISSLKKEKDTLEKKVKEFEDAEVPDREAIEKEVRAELEEEYKVKTHKAEKIAELGDQLLVPELVMGTTVEQIDASIEKALERSKEIRENLGIEEPSGDKKRKSPQRKKPDGSRTPRGTGSPSVGQVQDSKYSADYIASLDVRSQEYAEVRKQLGLK